MDSDVIMSVHEAFVRDWMEEKHGEAWKSVSVHIDVEYSLKMGNLDEVKLCCIEW